MPDTDDDKKKAEEDATAAAAGGDAGIAPDAEATIAQLKRDLQIEREGRAQAEARAAKKTNEASEAAGAVQDANLQLVTTAIDTVNAAQAALKIRYREALSNQDYDSASDINSEIATNAARLVQLESGREAMEAEKTSPRPRAADAMPVVDLVEALASQLTPRSAVWVRAHPEYVKDVRLNRKMIRAHEDAIDDGCEPDSDEYFKYVETRLGVKPSAASASPGAGGSDALSAAAGGKTRSGADGDRAPPALPPGKTGGGKDNIRLTPEQKEMAANMGMTDEEYRDNLVALKKDGRILN